MWKRLDIRASWDLGIKVRILKTLKITLRGNKSIMAVFDSQVVRLDVIARRVVGLDVSVREWSGWMFFRKFLRLCGRVGC